MKHPVACPNCGTERTTLEMWGRVNPATGKYIRRLLGFRIDTLLLSLAMMTMGVIYAVFYLLVLPFYALWRLLTFKKYSVKRFEHVCEACGYEWKQNEGEPAPTPATAD